MTPPASEPPLGWKTRTEVALSDDRLLALCVRHGDLLRTGPGRNREPVLAPSRNLAWDNHLRHVNLGKA